MTVDGEGMEELRKISTCVYYTPYLDLETVTCFPAIEQLFERDGKYLFAPHHRDGVENAIMRDTRVARDTQWT